MKQATRAARIIKMLQSGRPIARAEFLERLETSLATFKRDVEYLRREHVGDAARLTAALCAQGWFSCRSRNGAIMPADKLRCNCNTLADHEKRNTPFTAC